MGDAALVVDVADATAARRVADAVRSRMAPRPREVIGGISSVVVVLAAPPGAGDLAQIAGEIDDFRRRHGAPAGTGAGDGAPSALVVVPTAFDGPDLDEVAAVAGLDVPSLIGELTGRELTVSAVGFAPGFAYLSGLSPALGAIPRRSRPRSRVPAGSVALAGGFAAVYPRPSPGGWQLVGRTGLRLFDPTRPPFALLAPGDRVRFEVASSETPAAGAGDPEADRRPGARRWPGPVSGPAPDRPALTVETGGFLTTLQDAGRAGQAHLGVPGSGPADPVAHELANRLVGNHPGAAALEVTVRGPTLRFAERALVAAVGGDPELELDGHWAGADRVVPVEGGQRLQLLGTRSGARSYLAVGGSLDAVGTMGSCATDILSGLGPPPLQAGDRLGIGDRPGPPADHVVWSRLAPRYPADGRYVLRVVVGPDHSWFAPGLEERLGSVRFAVEADSDRVGLRLAPLEPPGGLARRPGEVASKGMVTGAVQVPESGRPVVLLPDHATLGGYPVVAVVIRADLHLLGQCRPGDEVRFEPVGLDAAAAAFGALRRSVDGALEGRYPVTPG
jgi:biotin-dependent carboxylase-like uncharacterized protein